MKKKSRKYLVTKMTNNAVLQMVKTDELFEGEAVGKTTRYF